MPRTNQVNVYIPKDIWEVVSRVAERDNVRVTQVVVAALKEVYGGKKKLPSIPPEADPNIEWVDTGDKEKLQSVPTSSDLTTDSSYRTTPCPEHGSQPVSGIWMCCE